MISCCDLGVLCCGWCFGDGDVVGFQGLGCVVFLFASRSDGVGLVVMVLWCRDRARLV